jgi:GNAT superfamily N-acetyltransferase
MREIWRVRKATLDDVAGVARVHVDSWRTTYKGIVQTDFLNGMSYENSESRWWNRLERNIAQYALFVAEDDSGRIIGFAHGGPERSGDTVYDGELYAIYLLEDYQRKGIGKQLFRSVVSHLTDNNFQAMLIWVLSDNPSRNFYESMGGQLIREAEIEIGGQLLQKSAYGWRNLEGLKEELSNY